MSPSPSTPVVTPVVDVHLRPLTSEPPCCTTSAKD